jgi:hypothetical protein
MRIVVDGKVVFEDYSRSNDLRYRSKGGVTPMPRRPVVQFFLLGLVVASASTQAQPSDLTFTLLTDSSVLNHYPGPDNLIGTADDVISAASAGNGPSNPNSPASLSYFTVTFSGSIAQQNEFQGDVIRFQTGSLDISATLAKGNSFNVVITGGTLMGTVANPFIGRSITTLGEQSGAPDGLSASFATNQTTGTFDHSTMTPDVESGPDTFPFPDQDIMSATVVVVPRASFGASGDAYMDNVVAPLVTSEEVTGIVRIEFEFTEVQNPDMGLDGALVQGVLVATTEDEIPPLSPGGGETPTSTFTLTMTPTPTATNTTMPILTSTFTLTPTPIETSAMTETQTPTLTPTLTATIQAILTCSADLDRDMDIDFQDLLIFVEQMRAFTGP